MTALEKFIKRIKVSPSGCWLWKPRLTKNGYGQFQDRKKTQVAHRASYEIFKGQIPEGFEIDHLCRVRHCVNPEHLEAVTGTENRLRAAKHRNACPSGHLFSDYGKVYKGSRYCKMCKRLRFKEWYYRKRLDIFEDIPKLAA